MKIILTLLMLLGINLYSSSSFISRPDDVKVLLQVMDRMEKPYVVYKCISLEIVGRCENWRAIDFGAGDNDCRRMNYGSMLLYHYNKKIKAWEYAAYWEYGSSIAYKESGLKDALEQLKEYPDAACIISEMRMK